MGELMEKKNWIILVHILLAVSEALPFLPIPGNGILHAFVVGIAEALENDSK